MPKKHTPASFQDTSGSTLEVDDGDITGGEIIAAAKLLRRRKACGSDDLPPEFWNAICNTSSPACRWAALLVLQLCSKGATQVSATITGRFLYTLPVTRFSQVVYFIGCVPQKLNQNMGNPNGLQVSERHI